MRRNVLAAAGVSSVMIAALAAQAPLSPPDLAARDQHLAQIALEAVARRDVEAIPLRSGDRIVGSLYDQFFLGVAVARAAAAAGAPMDWAALVQSPQWQSRRNVIVALPVDCDGKPDRPLVIRFLPGFALPGKPPDPPPAVRGDDATVASLLPGVRLPADALVAPEPSLPLPNARIEIDYAEPVCHGASTTATFTVVTIPGSAGRGVNALKLPEGSTDPSPTTVRISGLLDLDGKPRFMALAQGPDALAPTAMAALAAIRYTPTTINGVPAPLSALMPVVFTSTGAPGAMARPTPLPGTNGMVVTTTTAVPVAPSPSPAFPMDRRESLLARLAIETATMVAPISLDVDGSRRHGVFFNRFLLQQLAAHEAAGAAQPLDPVTPPPGFTAKNSLVVAVPIDCGHPVSAISIDMTGDAGRVLKVTGLLTGPDLGAAAPGQSWPPGTVGQLFATSGSVTGSQQVLLGYGEPACDDRNVALTLQHDPPHLVSTPPRPAAPAPLATVHVQGVMDTTGVPRYLVAVDGPSELAVAAVAAGSAWRFQPSRVNGTALPVPITLAIVLSPDKTILDIYELDIK